MIIRVLSQRLVLLVIGLAAGSGILIPASYGSLHPVTSSEIQDGTIQSVDIGTSQVKAVDIAADAVGASELQGVTKLLFGQCTLTSTEANTSVSGGGFVLVDCSISGVDNDDSAIATYNDGNDCFGTHKADKLSNLVTVWLINHCTTQEQAGSFGKIGIIVFDK